MTALSILMIALAYLVGSVSSAILVSRAFSLPDPRTLGSGNPGATNVYRLAGRFPALMVLIFDILKGTLPVYGSFLMGLDVISLGLVAIAACMGHIFPLFFGFKGGKAVATAFGCLLSLGFDLAGLLIVTWVLVVFVTGYSSLGAIMAVGLSPIFTYLLEPNYTLAVIMLSVVILLRHKANITRLLNGTEGKVWDRGRTQE